MSDSLELTIVMEGDLGPTDREQLALIRRGFQRRFGIVPNMSMRHCTETGGVEISASLPQEDDLRGPDLLSTTVVLNPGEHASLAAILAAFADEVNDVLPSREVDA